jgi:putative inorganic carbon (HCO3(-)) transporter
VRILLPLVLLYLSLFLLWGFRDLKKFLLFTGVFTIPFAIDYGFVYGIHIGWVSGVFIRLSDISFLLLPLVWLAGAGERIHLAPRISLPTLAFILACLFSLANSTAAGYTFYQVLQLATVFFCYFFIATNSLASREDLSLVVRFLMISLLFQSVLSIFQFQTAIDLNLRTGSEVSYMTVGEGWVRSYGTIGRPNGFGGYIVPLILLAQVMIISGVERRKGLCWVAMLLGVAALVFSFSRGAWVSFAVANLFLVAVALKRRLEWVRRLLLAQLVVGLVIFPFTLVIIERLFGYDAGAAWSRLPLMKLAWNMITDHPYLGVGGNTFLNVAYRYITPDIADAWVGEVHNMYLLVFAEAGVIGLAAFLWLMGAFFREASRLSRAEDPFLAALGLGGMAALVAVGTHMFVDMYTGSILLDLLFFLAAALAAGNRVPQGALSPLTEPRPESLRMAAEAAS